MDLSERWRCIDENAEAAQQDILRQVSAEGRLVPGQLSAAELRAQPPARGAAVMAMEWPDTPLRALAWLVSEDPEDGKPSWSMAGGTPYAGETDHEPLKVRAVRAEPQGRWAAIETLVPGGSLLPLFDPLYFQRGAAGYAIGETRTFAIAGIALEMSVIAHAHLAAEGDLADVSHPSSISMRGAALVLPDPRGGPGQCAFQGPVRSIGSFGFAGQTVFQVDATVMVTGEDRRIMLPIYVTRRAINGRVPAAGDDVAGTMWVQGHPVE